MKRDLYKRAVTPGVRRPRARLTAAAALLLLPLLAAAPARAELRFTVTNLGTLGGTLSEALAINASGQVAGRAGLANGATHATRWTNGVAQDLGTFGGRNSVAYGINDAGQVAGVANLAGDFFVAGALWAADGTPQQLIAPNTLDTAAFALNNGGAVVGEAPRALPATGIAPVTWRNGIAMSAALSIGATVSGSARAINNAGQVAGRVGDSAALWLSDAADVRLLPPLSGTLPTTAAAINAAGAVAGSALTTLGTTRAVLWQFGGVTDLGSLGGASSDAYGLNDRGEVVGRAMNAAGVFQGFIRAGGGMVNLNSMLAPGSGATVTTARAINVHGQIAGTATIAGQTRAVLLTPTGSVAWQAAGNGSFADAARWEQGFQPSKFVDAIVNGMGTQTITVGADAAAKNLSLGSAPGSAGRPTLVLQNGAALSVAGLLTVQGTGTLAGDGTVAGSVVNLGTVLPANLSVAGSFTNQGLVAGSGTLNAAVVNASTGQLHSGAGDLLRVHGANHSNAGVIDIRAGGEQHYSGALANAATGRILLNDAVLRLNHGATNAGQVQVSFGGATVYGSVATTTGGKVILSGNSQTTFFDAVSVDSGGELRVSNGSTGLFFSLVTQRTGALFTGTGTKFYEGGLAIGASPGLGLDAGSVNFGVGNQYTAEIGGTTACTAACETNAALRDSSFDKYIVAGHLALGGTLKLVSWAGFTGQIGQSFGLFDWGSSSGSFSSIDASGLSLASGAVLDTSQLYTAGVLRVTAVPEPGTWALLWCGIAVLLLRLRARRPAR
jgi:probable HAF family extracellular repeat protein